MDATYRAAELENARAELAKWRAVYQGLSFDKTRAEKKRKHDAAEQIEFWGNKVAFLTHAK